MPVQVAWYDAPHIIVGFWSGEISAQDMESFAEDIRALMVEAKAPLFVFADTSAVTRPYMNMGVIRARMGGIMNDERIAWWLGYGVTNSIINFLLMFVSRTFSLKVRTFETWESAQTFLEGLDTGLDFSRIPTPPAHTRQEI